MNSKGLGNQNALRKVIVLVVVSLSASFSQAQTLTSYQISALSRVASQTPNFNYATAFAANPQLGNSLMQTFTTAGGKMADFNSLAGLPSGITQREASTINQLRQSAMGIDNHVENPTAVPEPETYAAIMGAATFAVTVLRRRPGALARFSPGTKSR